MDKLAVFEQKEIRQIEHNGETWFSIIDIIEILTDSPNPSRYWTNLKSRENQLLRHCIKLKFQALDGKSRPSECVNVKGALIIIMSIPSPKVLSFKLWIAQAGEEKLNKLDNSITLSTLVLNHSQNNKNIVTCELKTYLMQDTFRGYYKIGKSKDPKVREGTLQAEVPTIELVHVIESDIENYLHKKFDSKRLRGEWFDLSEADVNYIKSY
jgi:prophage antirepressor-like protein